MIFYLKFWIIGKQVKLKNAEKKQQKEDVL